MLTVSIDTKLKVDVGGMHRSIKMKNQLAIKEIVDQGIKIIRKESPVDGGVFRDSVKRLDQGGADGNDGSTERFIRIGPSIYYSKFIIRGTRPSAGAYVPELDVRIRSGTHPGLKPNPVLVRSKRRLTPVIKAILRKHYGNFELGRFFE